MPLSWQLLELETADSLSHGGRVHWVGDCAGWGTVQETRGWRWPDTGDLLVVCLEILRRVRTSCWRDGRFLDSRSPVAGHPKASFFSLGQLSQGQLSLGQLSPGQLQGSEKLKVSGKIFFQIQSVHEVTLI